MDTQTKLQRKLYVKPYDRMVKDLVTEIDDRHIILDPDYQRNYVWNNIKASLLIESILLNIPIPVIYASEDEEGNWVIVDGLQRLYSLQRYFQDQFKLTGLETLTELNGLKYSNLDDAVRNKLDRGELRITVLQNESDKDIQFDIFMRLNTGSVKLNEQELRNCLYRGSLNNMIKEILSTKGNHIAEMFSPNSNRMAANELILRYLAMSHQFDSEKGSITNYKGSIKRLLNDYMCENQNPTEEELCAFKDKILCQFEKAYSLFGIHAFKKNAKSTQPSSSLADCMLIALEPYEIEDLLSKKEEILAMKEKLINDPTFSDYIEKRTGNSTAIVQRISIFSKALNEIMSK